MMNNAISILSQPIWRLADFQRNDFPRQTR
jgi:hypothetical protein